MAKQIVFYRHEEEKLEFRSGGPEHTPMRGKFGTSEHNMFKLKNVKIKGKEQHILILNGEEKILDGVEYEREPSWEMGPIGIPNANSGVTMPTNCDDYDPDIQQIILWVPPPSKAIPMDNEIRCKGFYDYGKEAPSGRPSELYEDDGGKDFFYPSWCRGMIPDPHWATARTARVNMLWYHDTPRGDYVLGRPDIFVDVVPKGNVVTQEKLGTMFAFTFQNRNGVAFSAAELEGADPRQRIIDLKVTGYGNDWCYHPVSII